MTYGIISDTHFHSWSQFSTTNETLVNSRLQILIDETRKAAQHMKDQGCEAIFHCGDIFHVRGRVAPSVLNPVADLFREIIMDIGLPVFLLAGNHDLEFEDANRIGNSGEALSRVGLKVVSEEPFFEHTHHVLMVPWHAKQKALLSTIEEAKARLLPSEVADWTLMIHAPVNEIIPGLPDHGIDPDVLAGLGFKHVFSGHYHNHKEVRPSVYSVGAMTHQTWGDIGSMAGYLMVDGDGVRQYVTDAPQFLDMANLEEDEFDRIAGNYVRAKIEISKEREIGEFRDMLVNELGATAALILPTRTGATVTRTGAVKANMDRLEDSITHFIKDSTTIHADMKDDVNAEVLKTLAETDHDL